MEKRRIAVVIGSDSDLPQCMEGLRYLQQAELEGRIEIVDGVRTMSVHRNIKEVLHFLDMHNMLGLSADVIIAGAGWAAHLPGMMDAYLAYWLHNQRIHVIGVGFEDPANEQHTLAAQLSISEVPGTRVLHKDEQGSFIGADGFLRGCKHAVIGELPALKEMSPRKSEHRTLDEAINAAEAAIAAAKAKAAATPTT